MKEVVKDLLNILTKEVIRCGDSVETRKTEAYFLATRLTELGYVKVVRCGECKWWTKVEGENYGWCDELFSRLTADLPYTDKDFYCSQGERNVDVRIIDLPKPKMSLMEGLEKAVREIQSPYINPSYRTKEAKTIADILRSLPIDWQAEADRKDNLK